MKNLSLFIPACIIFIVMSLPVYTQVIDTSRTTKVYDYDSVSVKPQYPGGEKAMYSFISKNVNYPEAAKDQGLEGKVYVWFIIDTYGQMRDIEILEGLSRECDEECLRVVKKMPKWEPGKENGVPVMVKCNVVFVFSMH